jgi:uncharacterized protein (TIGR03437 family)
MRMKQLSLMPVTFWMLTLPSPAAAEIMVLALTDAATFTPGLPQVGSLGTIFCTGLTGISGVQTATRYPLPFEMSGVSVWVHSIKVPLLAIADFGSYQQINFQRWDGCHANPYVVVTQGGATGSILIPTQPPAWGVFFTDANGYGAAQHSDYSLVTPDHPARPGDILVAYATNLVGFAGVYSHPNFGMPAPSDPLARIP